MYLLKLQECEFVTHFQCLPEPITSLDELPGGKDADFYCPHCKNDESEIVGAGKLKRYLFIIGVFMCYELVDIKFLNSLHLTWIKS